MCFGGVLHMSQSKQCVGLILLKWIVFIKESWFGFLISMDVFGFGY